MGFAYDSDADRCLAVDNGNIIDRVCHVYMWCIHEAKK